MLSALKNIHRLFSAAFLLLVPAACPLYANDYWKTVEQVKCEPPAKWFSNSSGDGYPFGFACGGPIESGPEDIFECYAPDEKGLCRQSSRYASRTRLPVIGDPEAFDNDIDCYRYKDEAYIVVVTSIPEQVEDTLFHYASPEKCYRTLEDCIKARTVPDSVVQWKKTFYSCANTETTKDGCRFAKNGLALIYDEKGKLKEWNIKGLRLYLSMKSITNATKFIKKVEQEYTREEEYTKILPWRFYDESADSLARATVARAKGMQVYSALKKADRFGGKFPTMQDAIKACKAWKAKGAK